MAFKSMQDETGGYCPMCDTVWTSSGKCRCEPVEKLPPEHSYFITDDGLVADKNSWNAAIEAAANVSEINSAAEIRKLKK